MGGVGVGRVDFVLSGGDEVVSYNIYEVKHLNRLSLHHTDSTNCSGLRELSTRSRVCSGI